GILQHCGRGDIEKASEPLQVLWDQGYSALDIITTLFRVVKQDTALAEAQKMDFVREIGMTHMKILEGVQSLVQLYGLLARMCRSTMPPAAFALS
ncbi:replication factor C subunit 4, partial [Tieghemiomyces parasiticus]